jgi:2-isopropylmalate synthase
MEKAAEAGIELDEEAAARTLERVKELEHEGFQFEAADGSFELLMRQEAGVYQPLFVLLSWRVIVEKRFDLEEGPYAETEATIKLVAPPGPEEAEYICTAEGNGPVNALDKALRQAIGDIYPHLRDIDLVNFKVRILDETHGTGAITRVLIDATDGKRVWGSIGVSQNVIEASWDALVDSLEVGVQSQTRTTRA